MKAFGFTQKLFSYGGHQASALRLHLVALRLTPAVSATPLSQDARAEAAADRAAEGLVLSKKKKKFAWAPSLMPSGFAAVLTGIPAKNVNSITLNALRRMESGFCPV